MAKMWIRMQQVLSDRRGVETLEWVAVGAAIVALAVTVYAKDGTLATAITDVITSISGKLTVL
jgi:hypothetical protein